MASVSRASFCVSCLRALVLLGSLSACAQGGIIAALETNRDCPPPVQVEEKALEIQNPQIEIWIPGYWAPGPLDFIWVAGTVVARPDPTAVWAPARWDHHTYGWSFVQGYWQ